MFKIRVFNIPSKKGAILVQAYTTYKSGQEPVKNNARHCNFYIPAAQAKEIKDWALKVCPNSIIIEHTKYPYPNYMKMWVWAKKWNLLHEYPSVSNINNMRKLSGARLSD